MTRVLVVEDDAQTAAEIAAALGDHGFDVECAHTGQDALDRAVADRYSAIVLDRMLPGGIDGLTVLSTLRGLSVDAPVLILSALSAVDERVRGLRAGGDDYLTKPFESLELTARIEVLRGGRTVDLLPREYRLLEYLLRHPGQVITRTMLFEEVWSYRYDQRTNVIDVHMGKLRRKLDEGGLPSMIQTVRGSGYILRAPD